MRNYINNLKANSKKGFSLVELIIVIAIMAILVGIVASQVIPYMEKSRKGKDQQQISGVTTAGVSTIADHKTAITKIDAGLISAWDSATASAPVATGVDEEFRNNMVALLSTDGESYTSGDNAHTLTGLMSTMEGKFKSKAFTKTSYHIYAQYDAGTFTTFVNSGTSLPTDEKLKAVSE